MKIKLSTLIFLVLSVTGYAQMPHIVQGYFLNPDLSKPALGEIKFQGYLTKSPLDTTVTVLCGVDGAWALELVYMEKINNANWQPGDTLVVVYENIAPGPFQGAKSSFRYVTTADSPEDVGEIALPVEMTTFTARVHTTSLAEEVILEWRTASEKDNLGFEVQRSQDGKNFAKIGFVAGHGTTNQEKVYSFTDRDVTVAKYFYRLKQIDRDGSFSFSDIQQVIVTAPERFELSQNFPNPFNPKTDIIFRLRQDGLVVLKVYDLLGREVRTLVNEKLNAGTHRVTFDGRDLPSGMYLYTITAGNFTDVKKMVLIK